MKLSILIPARDEERVIGQTITVLRDYLEQNAIRDFEILVVDDGSQDQTYAVVAAERVRDCRIQVIRNPGQNGFGRAVIYGLDHFTGDAIVIYMADASDAPEDVVNYYHILYEKADCAFGSRFVRGSKVTDYPKFKLIVNCLVNIGIKLIFNIPYNDTTNAFKAYRRDVIDGCRPFISPHFNFTIELPLKAIVRGYSYQIVPIRWRNRYVGESHLKLREQGSRYLFTLLTVWFEWLLIRGDNHRPAQEHFEPWFEDVLDRQLPQPIAAEEE